MKKHLNSIKLFVTGGHVTPAVALMEAVKERHPNWQMVFVGRTHALGGTSVESEEQKIVERDGYRFLPLKAGRLTRAWDIQTIWSLVNVPVGFFQAIVYCLREKPDAIVSFGGYVALPVVLSGWALGISSITHEQTFVPGLANRIISRVAAKICVSFAEVVRFFPKQKTIVTGLPVRQGFMKPSNMASVPPEENFPLLYITGGATGAVSLNELIFPVLSRLTRRFRIVHQTGRVSYEKDVKIRNALPLRQQKRYIILQYIPMSELSGILRDASIVVGRSGANTVYELAMMGKVAVLVPLPWSAGGEQQKNAAWLAQHGSARVVNQKQVNAQDLANTIETLWADHKQMQQRALNFANKIPGDGAKRMLAQLETVLGI